MKSDTYYRSKLEFRARGLEALASRVGDVTAAIDARLGDRDVVRVLDLGCGYGTVLLELKQRYGARVDVHGVNRRPGDGDGAIIARNGLERGLIAEGNDTALPTIAYADVADGLPYADRMFDIVVSQVAWLYFGNKLRVLREVSRILRDDGIARIDADELCPRLPHEYARLVEIWHSGQLLPFADYLRRRGASLERAKHGEYIAMPRVAGLGDDLTLVREVDVSDIDPSWDGIKCIYRMRSD